MNTLESRLDYMDRYLELDRGHAAPATIRAPILKWVKDTIAWKSQLHPSDEVRDNVTEMDEFMMRIVQGA